MSEVQTCLSTCDGVAYTRRVTLPAPADLLALKDSVSATQAVRLVDGPAGAWAYDGSEIFNEKADFFRVTGHVDPGGGEHLLIQQKEHALVGLVTARSADGVQVLLNARAEPGLVGTTQFSSTIQSTPSNYLRKHGGAPTPFIDEVLTPPDGARVVYDALQYDWGGYYHAKVKRFRIVELAQPRAADVPLVWVGLETLREMLGHDHLITSDLRVATAMLLRVDAGDDAVDAGTGASAPSVLTTVPISSLTRWTVTPAGVLSDTEDREIVWASTSSRTREVTSWVQPLMRLKEPLETSLPARRTPAGLRFAVRRATQPGLDGTFLWFPATPGTGAEVARVELSAEGGRFYRHVIVASLVEAEPLEQDVTWVSLAELERLAALPTATSLELRCLLSLVQVSGAR